MPDFDGLTLNKHAILGVSDVQAWFEKVGCKVPHKNAVVITKMLNRFEFEGAFWKNTPELKKWRRNNPLWARNRRVATALYVLERDLPAYIDEGNKVLLSARQRKKSKSLERLLTQVNKVAPRFNWALRRRGRGPDLWHRVARKVGGKIVEALKASGKSRVGLGKPTSPAIEVLQQVLAYLGQEVSLEAIVDAVRPKRERKKRGKIAS